MKGDESWQSRIVTGNTLRPRLHYTGLLFIPDYVSMLSIGDANCDGLVWGYGAMFSHPPDFEVCPNFYRGLYKINSLNLAYQSDQSA
jgi:hypothetical protein